MADVKLSVDQKATMRLALRTLEASLRRGLSKAQSLGRSDYAAVIEQDIAKCLGIGVVIEKL